MVNLWSSVIRSDLLRIDGHNRGRVDGALCIFGCRSE